jgi:hypothetical protein
MLVRVSDIAGNAAAHNITVAAGGGGWQIDVLTLGGPGATATIATGNQSATWSADVPAKVWRFVGVN